MVISSMIEKYSKLNNALATENELIEILLESSNKLKRENNYSNSVLFHMMNYRKALNPYRFFNNYRNRKAIRDFLETISEELRTAIAPNLSDVSSLDFIFRELALIKNAVELYNVTNTGKFQFDYFSYKYIREDDIKPLLYTDIKINKVILTTIVFEVVGEYLKVYYLSDKKKLLKDNTRVIIMKEIANILEIVSREYNGVVVI